MADFGNSGKITIRTNHESATVRVGAGEYLAYKLTVKGATPIFVFACTHNTRLSQGQFPGHPKQVYEWTWCRPTAGPAGSPDVQSDGDDDTYEVVMHFAAAVKYTLFVEQRDQNNARLRVIKDIDFESQGPEDKFPEGLDVFQS